MDGLQAQRGQACPPEVTPDAGKQMGAVHSRSLRVAACGLLGALSVLPLDSDDRRLPLGRATVEASCVQSLRNTPWVKEGNPFAEVTWTPLPATPPLLTGTPWKTQNARLSLREGAHPGEQRPGAEQLPGANARAASGLSGHLGLGWDLGF